MKWTFTKVFILCDLAVIIGLPVGSYALGYRPPQCCVRDSGTIYQIIEREQPALFAPHLVWDLYYNATSIHTPFQYAGITTVNCNYYKIGMTIDLDRNIQKPIAFNPAGIVANGTGFIQLVNAPQGC